MCEASVSVYGQVRGGSAKVFLGDKGSRGHVCPQLCVGSPISALRVRSHEALGAARHPCITLGVKYVSAATSAECGQGGVCVRQTDARGTESQLSAQPGGLGQRPAQYGLHLLSSATWGFGREQG